ncbi:HlyD family efflux transporter periplasmic adaptor subunit [Clostridium sp.]|uniref:HlyD family efflux transporter periplasmic adaptor subunit n=1 Tax=Clostridium sp. TaxID=1506 RepID=UPI002FC63A8B
MLRKIGIRNSLIYLFCIAIVYVTFIYKMPVETVTATMTSYYDKVSFKGMYFAKEYVLEGSDSLTFKSDDGYRVAKGEKITSSLKSPEAGVLIGNIDGFENKYNLKNIKSLSLTELDKIIGYTPGNKGIKIIDPDNVYIYSFLNKDGSFKKGQVFTIEIGNKKFRTIVEDSISRKEGTFLILKLIDGLDFNNFKRGFNGNIIKSDYKGFKIPSSAVRVVENGYKVLVRKSNGYVDEKSVNVLYDDGEYAVVVPKKNSTLKEYDNIIVSPKASLKEGSRVR